MACDREGHESMSIEDPNRSRGDKGADDQPVTNLFIFDLAITLKREPGLAPGD